MRGARVSPSLFPLLRVTPHMGRLFMEEEARTGAERVVLLSHDSWTNRFASDPAIVGTTINFDSNPHVVVGVLAEGFYFPTPTANSGCRTSFRRSGTSCTGDLNARRYGLFSYIVTQRQGEIGIRMALGAGRGAILTLVIGQGAAVVGTGAIIGIGTAVASSQILESLLYGVATDDRLTFLLAPLVLVTVGLFACWLPARRATGIDPAKMLRFE